MFTYSVFFFYVFQNVCAATFPAEWSEREVTIFYITSTSDDSLSGVIITGGGALIPGLLEGLEALLGFPASILSPFEKLEYDRKKFSEEQLNMISFRGGVAMGLAMRSLH